MELYLMHAQGAVKTHEMCVSLNCPEVSGTSIRSMVPSPRLVLPYPDFISPLSLIFS